MEVAFGLRPPAFERSMFGAITSHLVPAVGSLCIHGDESGVTSAYRWQLVHGDDSGVTCQ